MLKSPRRLFLPKSSSLSKDGFVVFQGQAGLFPKTRGPAKDCAESAAKAGGELSTMLENYPKEIILRDGVGVSLRPLRQGDEDPLFDMYNRLPEEDRWFLDADVSNIEMIRNWVRKAQGQGIVSIVGVLEGKIIAHATLAWNIHGAKSHIGKIGITVDPSFRERHLGTWLLLDLHNLAISVGLEVLLMPLVEDRDTSFIQGVRRLEFCEEAVLKNYVKDREGNPRNLVIMVKRLRRGWGKITDMVP